MRVSYLERLNPEQGRAAEYGVVPGASTSPPLLVIARAGIGNTNTLCARVAHLNVSGSDPGRVLPITFSRRAVAGMIRRAEQICLQALGAMAGAITNGVIWAGAFHAVGAFLLRAYADQIGIDPDFTIRNREELLTRLVNGWPRSRIGELTPWHCAGATTV